MSKSVHERRYDDVQLGSDMAVNQKNDGVDRLDALFTHNYAALTRLIYRVVGDIGWAEELASEAFWRLHRNPPASDDNLAGWLSRTGLRLALDNLRKRKRRAHYEALAPTTGTLQTPEQTTSQQEQAAQVREVLAALKPEQAGLLVLRSEGHSQKEMAATLRLNPASVGTLLARADTAFRKEYIRRYGTR